MRIPNVLVAGSESGPIMHSAFNARALKTPMCCGVPVF